MKHLMAAFIAVAVMGLGIVYVVSQNARNRNNANPGQDAREAIAPDESVQYLSALNTYGFGVADGETAPRKSDVFLKEILGSSNAEERLLTLFRNGNTVGKLFAVYGLMKIQSNFYQSHRDKIDRTTMIRRRDGCVLSEETAGEIIDTMKDWELGL